MSTENIVEEERISRAALHVCAEACRLKMRPELTDDERDAVGKAIKYLMAVSQSTEARKPMPELETSTEDSND